MKNFYELRLISFRNIRLSLTLHRFPNGRTPYDTGAADRYYGRRFLPRYTNVWGKVIDDLTPKQTEEYKNGYDEEEDRKDWG